MRGSTQEVVGLTLPAKSRKLAAISSGESFESESSAMMRRLAARYERVHRIFGGKVYTYLIGAAKQSAFCSSFATPLAQRKPACAQSLQAGGRRFESCTARHRFSCLFNAIGAFLGLPSVLPICPCAGNSAGFLVPGWRNPLALHPEDRLPESR